MTSQPIAQQLTYHVTHNAVNAHGIHNLPPILTNKNNQEKQQNKTNPHKLDEQIPQTKLTTNNNKLNYWVFEPERAAMSALAHAPFLVKTLANW
jgi:hypothetical protein